MLQEYCKHALIYTTATHVLAQMWYKAYKSISSSLSEFHGTKYAQLIEMMLLLKYTTGAVRIQVEGEGEHSCALKTVKL